MQPAPHRWTSPRSSRLPALLPVLVAACSLVCCAGPPEARPGQVLGYGTPGVESYLPPGDARTLTTLQERCRGVPDANAPPPQTLAAACDQLRRTVHNQPGNALSP